LILAIFLSAAAAAAYPAPAQGALFIDDASGLKAFLDKAGTYARSLSSDEVGRQLKAQCGVNPLERKGTLVVSEKAFGYVTPMPQKEARALLKEWKRAAKLGLWSKGKLYTASGRDAKTMLKALQHSRPLRLENKPLTFWVATAAPFRSATGVLDASPGGLIATGVVTADAPILEGQGPPPCSEDAIGCLRIALGPAAKTALLDAPIPHGEIVSGLREKYRDDIRKADRIAARLERIDAGAISNERSIPRALHYSISFDDPSAEGPQLEVRLDLAKVETAFLHLTPLDALSGEAAAMAYAGHLIYTRLLQNLGPLVVTAQTQEGAAHFELRLPLR
jgi:hypothetical protein